MGESSRHHEARPLPLFHSERLTVVAGPPCVGKSYLIEEARWPENQPLRDLFVMGEGTDFVEIHAAEVDRFQGERLDHVILHYDLLRQSSPTGFQHLDAPLAGAADAAIVTLWESTDVLRRRVRKRLLSRVGGIMRGKESVSNLRHHLSKARRLGRFYKDTVAVERLCAGWFEYAAQICGEDVPHWLKLGQGQPRLVEQGTSAVTLARELVPSPP
jgi:hypothetical protein